VSSLFLTLEDGEVASAQQTDARHTPNATRLGRFVRTRDRRKCRAVLPVFGLVNLRPAEQGVAVGGSSSRKGTGYCVKSRCKEMHRPLFYLFFSSASCS
jgi:hypothetical protein